MGRRRQNVIIRSFGFFPRVAGGCGTVPRSRAIRPDFCLENIILAAEEKGWGQRGVGGCMAGGAAGRPARR